MAETKLSAHNGTYKHRTVRSGSLVGLSLGELRALIETCADLPDTSLVFVSGVTAREEDKTKAWVKEIHVQHSEAAK